MKRFLVIFIPRFGKDHGSQSVLRYAAYSAEVNSLYGVLGWTVGGSGLNLRWRRRRLRLRRLRLGGFRLRLLGRLGDRLEGVLLGRLRLRRLRLSRLWRIGLWLRRILLGNRPSGQTKKRHQRKEADGQFAQASRPGNHLYRYPFHSALNLRRPVILSGFHHKRAGFHQSEHGKLKALPEESGHRA